MLISSFSCILQKLVLISSFSSILQKLQKWRHNSQRMVSMSNQSNQIGSSAPSKSKQYKRLHPTRLHKTQRCRFLLQHASAHQPLVDAGPRPSSNHKRFLKRAHHLYQDGMSSCGSPGGSHHHTGTDSVLDNYSCSLSSMFVQ